MQCGSGIWHKPGELRANGCGLTRNSKKVIVVEIAQKRKRIRA